MADFFVLLADGDADEGEVRRLLIDHEIAVTIDQALSTARQSLEADDIERIPLGNDSYKPDETEVWIVPNFQLPPHLQGAVDQPLDCPAFVGPAENLHRVRALVVSWPEEDVIGFQALDRRNVLSTKGFTLIHGQNTFRRLEDPAFLLKNDIHAVLHDDTLIFRSMHWARRLFNMTPYYEEATEEDVDYFAESELIAVDDPNALRENSDSWVRKRIGVILESGVLDQTSASVIRDRGDHYDLQVEVREENGVERVVLPSDKSALKKLLRLLEERYYDGPLSDARYLANSKRRL